MISKTVVSEFSNETSWKETLQGVPPRSRKIPIRYVNNTI